MDGYTLTNRMRQTRRSYRFTAVEQALFYELVAICNSENWCDTFSCSNIELCYVLNITEKTLIKARETLINSGILFYKSGKSKRSVGKYSFTKSTTVKIPVDSTVDTTVDDTVDRTVKPPDLYKQQTETKEYANDFEIFFSEYHKITGMKKTDKNAALKKWNKLLKTEKAKALSNIKPYFDSLNNKQYCKKCRTYLEDKNFNDEFETKQHDGNSGFKLHPAFQY